MVRTLRRRRLQSNPAKHYELPSRGIGLPWTIRALSELLRVNNLMVVFLSETKVGLRRIEVLKERLVMNGIRVEASGRSGGLALLWYKKITVSIQSYSLNHIDAIVNPDDSTAPWWFTGFYGEPDSANRGKKRGIYFGI